MGYQAVVVVTISFSSVRLIIDLVIIYLGYDFFFFFYTLFSLISFNIIRQTKNIRETRRRLLLDLGSTELNNLRGVIFGL